MIKLNKLLYDAAKNSEISIHQDFKYHKFHWLLESKRNTDGIFYQENRTHLQSCDSILRKNSDEFLESHTIKSLNKTPKEEMKLVSSPKEPKKEKKPKKKTRKHQKGTRMPLSQARNYTSQVNCSFINKSNNKIGSPGFIYQNKIQARDFKNKMNKMLDVNANNINESQNSVISSPSKLKLDNTLSYKKGINERKEGADEECKIPIKRDSRFFVKMM